MISEFFREEAIDVRNLFDVHEHEIEDYCLKNGLNFMRLKSMPKCWGKNDVWVQYHSEKSGLNGLKEEIPAPVVLKICKKNGKLSFEQTEYTRKYLT